MALDFTWTPKVDGVDVNRAKDVNDLAKGIADTQEEVAILKESGGGAEKPPKTIGDTDDCDYKVIGSAFSATLKTAVEEAEDGDIIIIKARTVYDEMYGNTWYEDFGTSFTLDKNITLIGEGNPYFYSTGAVITISVGCTLAMEGLPVGIGINCQCTTENGYVTGKSFIRAKKCGFDNGFLYTIIGDLEECNLAWSTFENPTILSEYFDTFGYFNQYKNCTVQAATFGGAGAHTFTDCTMTSDDMNGAPVFNNTCSIIRGTIINSASSQITVNASLNLSDVIIYGAQLPWTGTFISTTNCMLVAATPI